MRPNAVKRGQQDTGVNLKKHGMESPAEPVRADPFDNDKRDNGDQINRQESNPWEFDWNSKGQKSSHRQSNEPGDDSSSIVEPEASKPKVAKPAFNAEEDFFKKKDINAKQKPDMFIDFGGKKDDYEPGNFKFQGDDSSSEKPQSRVEDNKADASHNSRQLHNKSKLSASNVSKKLIQKDVVNDSKAHSKKDFNWDEFGEASEAASVELEGSKIHDSRVSRSRQSHRSSANRGAAPVIRKKDNSVVDQSREQVQSFHDMFNKSKAEVSMSRDEGPTRKLPTTTAVKIAPPQPKLGVNSLRRPEPSTELQVNNGPRDLEIKTKEARDKLWGNMEEPKNTKPLTTKNPAPESQSTPPARQSEQDKEPVSIAKPFASLFEDFNQPEVEPTSFRRSQVRRGSRNDSMSREDRLALSVPAIAGTGSGFGRRGRQNISIRVNRSTVGDTGIGEKKVLGTQVNSQIQNVAINSQTRIPEPIPVIKVSEPTDLYEEPKPTEVVAQNPVEEFVDPFDAINFNQSGIQFEVSSPKTDKDNPWEQHTKNQAASTSQQAMVRDQEEKQDIWEADLWADKKSVHSNTEKVSAHGKEQKSRQVPPSDHQLSKEASRVSNARGPLGTGQSANHNDEPVFDFDDFEAASEGGQEEQAEEGFGDESLEDQGKKVLDPFSIGASDIFSGKQQLGEHHFSEPVNTQVDNPDFFNSQEFGNVGGIGNAHQGEVQKNIEAAFDDSLPFVSPIKQIQNRGARNDTLLSLSTFHSLHIPSKTRPVTRNYKAFHILSRMGIPTEDLLSPFYNRVSSTPETPKGKFAVNLSIRAFSIGYFFPAVRYDPGRDSRIDQPRDAILLMSQLPSTSYLPPPSMARSSELARQAAALAAEVDRLEKDLRDERNGRSKLTEDLIAAESSFMRDKAMHTELMRKHTALLNTCEEKTKREKVLQAELNQYHKRLMKLTERDAVVDRPAESRHAADDALKLASAVDRDTHSQVVEALNAKIQSLVKESVDLRHRLMEAQVAVDMKQEYKQVEESTFIEIESSVHNLMKEKQIWAEERMALQAEIDSLNERLSERDIMTKEVELIRQVLLMEGEEGQLALNMLREMVAENDEPAFSKVKVKESGIEIEKQPQQRRGLEVQLLFSLVQVEPKPKFAQGIPATSELEPDHQEKPIDFATSFGVNPQATLDNIGTNSIEGNTVKSDQVHETHCDIAPASSTIFDSFGGEVKHKFTFDGSNTEPAVDIKSIDIIANHATIKLPTIIESNDNIDIVSISMPVDIVDKCDDKLCRIDDDRLTDSHHQAVDNDRHFDIQANKPISPLVSMMNIQQYGSWISEDHMPSTVSPRLQNPARDTDTGTVYVSALSCLLDANKIKASLAQTDRCFLRGSIKLCLKSCEYEEDRLKIEVSLESTSPSFKLVRVSVSNYESSRLNNRRLSSPAQFS